MITSRYPLPQEQDVRHAVGTSVTLTSSNHRMTVIGHVTKTHILDAEKGDCVTGHILASDERYETIKVRTGECLVAWHDSKGILQTATLPQEALLR